MLIKQLYHLSVFFSPGKKQTCNLWHLLFITIGKCTPCNHMPRQHHSSVNVSPSLKVLCAKASFCESQIFSSLKNFDLWYNADVIWQPILTLFLTISVILLTQHYSNSWGTCVRSVLAVRTLSSASGHFDMRTSSSSCISPSSSLLLL